MSEESRQDEETSGLGFALASWQRALEKPAWGLELRGALGASGLSLALALFTAQHAGVPYTLALWTLVIGGVIVAFFGGSSLSVAGPGLVMGFAVMSFSRRFGSAGLAFAGMLTGLAQVLLGALRIGRYAQLIPLSLLRGFVLGVGLLLCVQGLPWVLGLETPAELNTLHLLDHMTANLGRVRLVSLALGLGSFVLCVGLRKFAPKLPAALLVLAVATLVTALGHLHVDTLPDLPWGLTRGAPPAMPGKDTSQFVGMLLGIFALATLETVLSANVEDERAPGGPLRPSQELLGYGLANTVLGMLGALPATGSFVRSEALRAAGGHSRLGALFQALVSGGLALVVLGVDRWLPLPAVGGVVLASAMPLVKFAEIRAIWSVSRAQTVVAILTSTIIVFDDLLDGVEASLGLTAVLVLVRVARTRAVLHKGKAGGSHQVTFSGPVTFLSLTELASLREQLGKIDLSPGVIFDLRSVQVMDHTGSARFLDVLRVVVRRGGKFVVLAASPAVREMLLAGDAFLVRDRFAVGDREVDAVLGRARSFEMRAHVIANMERFRSEVRAHYSPLLEQFEEGQQPHTLFVTCVDSRIAPELLTGSHPGELFIVRCLGAIVGPPHEGPLTGVGAAVEYAVGVLGVRNIVVCGHSHCGAIKAVKHAHVPEGLPMLQAWLNGTPAAVGDVAHAHDVDDAARMVIVRQLEALMEFALVKGKVDQGELSLHAWFYDVGHAELYEYDTNKRNFSVLGQRRHSLLPPSH